MAIAESNKAYSEAKQNRLTYDLPEAIVYLLASSNHGMKTDVIARLINEKGLYQRWDGKPVDGKQIYACVMAHPETFVKSEGLIRLMI